MAQEKLKTVRTMVCCGIFWSGQLSCSQIWNIEKEKEKETKKVGDRPARLNEKKSQRQKTKEKFFVGGTI